MRPQLSPKLKKGGVDEMLKMISSPPKRKIGGCREFKSVIGYKNT
jgi:hypothetical protein